MNTRIVWINTVLSNLKKQLQRSSMPFRFEKVLTPRLIATLGRLQLPLHRGLNLAGNDRACGSCHLQLSSTHGTTPEVCGVLLT